MKGWTLVRKGTPERAFELQDMVLPEPGNDQALVEVEGFGLNYADIMCRKGLYREAPPFPFVPGYEIVGKVVKAPGESQLVGKRVVGFTRFGGYATHAITPVVAVTEISAEMPLGEALALAVQYITAYHAAYDMVNLHKGDKVLIHAAAGGVGIALTQLCKLKGCEVFGTASQPEKLELMKQNGVDHVINYRTQDYETEINKILGDQHLDVAFNAIGGSTYKKDARLVGTAGRQVLYGGAERSDGRMGIFSTLGFVRRMGLVVPIFMMMKSRGLLGVNMLKVADDKPEIIARCMAAVVELYDQGKLKPHVGATFSGEEVDKAHELMENRGSMGKIAVKW